MTAPIVLTVQPSFDSFGQSLTQVAKFMPCFDGPYLVIDTFPEASMVTLDIPNAPNLFPTFPTSHVKPFKNNDNTKYPSHSLAKPGPIVMDSTPEHFVQTPEDHRPQEDWS